MHYNLLFNGCSFTVGNELERFGGIEYVKSHRYSTLISNHFNKTHDNIAVGGSSNDAIVERTIEWFEEGNTCDFAIIQWTFKDRQLYYYNHEKEYFIFPHGVIFDAKRNIPLSEDNLDKLEKEKIKIKIKRYYSIFYSDELGNQNLHKNIFFLKKYFELHNIKYFFISLPQIEHCISDSYNHNLKLFSIVDCGKGKSILGKIDSKSENFCDRIIIHTKTGRKLMSPGTHPSEIGHQKIANYIIKEIENAL